MTARASDDLLPHLRRARDHADRNYSEPLDLAALAAISGISKYHFQRLFVATYGVSPAEHLSRRRIERAQDLLRATNLTVTEICTAVGFASLGSFSSRFRARVGDAPPVVRARGPAGAPRTPSGNVFWGGGAAGHAPAAESASEEKPPAAGSS